MSVVNELTADITTGLLNIIDNLMARSGYRLHIHRTLPTLFVSCVDF